MPVAKELLGKRQAVATIFGVYQSFLRMFKAHADHAVRVRIPGSNKCTARDRHSPEEAADLECAIRMRSRDRGKKREKR